MDEMRVRNTKSGNIFMTSPFRSRDLCLVFTESRRSMAGGGGGGGGGPAAAVSFGIS